MRTSKEYIEKLDSMNQTVYMYGEKVKPTRDPRIRAGINVISLTYDLPHDPRYEEVLTARSHLTGETINRFTHVHQSTDDLVKKVNMTRLYCQQTGGCIQRCMGIDAMNALSVVTYNMDQELGTDYHKRFNDYLAYVQENDMTMNGAMTDVKGDRSLRPHQQPDPDLYLHVVERQADGIIVKGAKAHNTAAPYAEDLIVMPTRAMVEEDADYAVSFAIPADAPGIKLICRATAPGDRPLFEKPLSSQWGVVDSMTIFDGVFVPWERVFMCGEWQYAGQLAALFANYHRHSYTGCKPAMSDLLIGGTALIAEYNGVARASHIRQKLTDMIMVAEMVYACGMAASMRGTQQPSGTYLPDTIYSNIGKYYAGTNLHHEYELAQDIAGGLLATMPSEKDYLSEETGEYLKKYLAGAAGVSVEQRLRCFRLLEDMTTSRYGAFMLVASVHGGGSPEAERIAVLQNYDLESRKEMARRLAGIVPTDLPSARFNAIDEE